ncbi:MAG: hypothetical protein ACRCUI_09970, partial [Polymorphobacter sp.]
IASDAAIPVAFLITELARIAVLASPAGEVALEISATRDGDVVMLAVASTAFVAADCVAVPENAAAARIIHGMVRQLRSQLHHDRSTGRYWLRFIDQRP